MASPYDRLQFAQAGIVPQYQGAPIDEFSQLLAKREQDYQQNVAALDQIQLAGADLDINDADYAVKSAAMDKVKEGINSIAESGGAYEMAGAQVRQIAKDFTTDEALRQAITNQSTIKEKTKELQDLYVNDKISETGYREALKRMGNYQGIGEGEEGVYEGVDIYNPVKYVDVKEQLNKYGQGWKADKFESGWYEGKDGFLYNQIGEQVKETEVRDAMNDYALSDPSIRAMIDEDNKYGEGNLLEGAVEAQVAKLGYESKKTAIQQDPYALARYKQGLADAERFKEGMGLNLYQRVDGSPIKSASDYAEMTTITSDSIKELTGQINREKAKPTPNEAEIHKLEDQRLQLEQKKESLDANDLDIRKRAFRNAGQEYDPNYQPSPEDEVQASMDAITNSEIYNLRPGRDAPQTNIDAYTRMVTEFKETAEYNFLYAESLAKYDPVAAEMSELYVRQGEDQIALTKINTPSSPEERKAADELGASIYGRSATSQTKNRPELSDEGAEGLGVGFRWFGTERGGVIVDNDDLEGSSGVKYTGSVLNPRTGKYEYVYNLLDGDGLSIGQVSFGGPDAHNYIARQMPNRVGELAGPQIMHIRNSIDGKGLIDLSTDDNVNPIEVNYLGRDPEAAEKEGQFKVRMLLDDGTYGEKVLPTNRALMEFIQNAYNTNR